jgi:hypothetical protein
MPVPDHQFTRPHQKPKPDGHKNVVKCYQLPGLHSQQGSNLEQPMSAAATSQVSLHDKKQATRNRITP